MLSPLMCLRSAFVFGCLIAFGPEGDGGGNFAFFAVRLHSAANTTATLGQRIGSIQEGN